MKWGIRTIVTIIALMLLFSACDAHSNKIDVPVTGNMKIVHNGFDPDLTFEAFIETIPSISIDDEKQILSILNGKEYVNDAPACVCDLIINSDNNMFLIHTEGGAVITTVDDRSISCILSDTELKELLTICETY